MVERQLEFNILQLVALSLPAFAILLQIVVESEMAYTYWAVPLTTGGLVMFLIGGAIIVGEFMFTTTPLTATVALGAILFGMCSLLIGASLIGLQTKTKQHRLRDDDN